METLYLSLNKAAFDCMVTGEKEIEVREASDWIISRIFDKNGNRRQYDQVKFTNGYGANRPCFIAKFKRSFTFENPHTVKFTTGLVVRVHPGMIAIDLGEITERGNLTRRHWALIERRKKFVKSLKN